MARGRKTEDISESMLGHLRNTIEQPLREEIDKLRHTILELARDQQLVYDALEKGMGEAEPWQWQSQAVKAIIQHMTAGPLVKLPPRGIYRHMPGVITMGHARAPCPLCGAGREPFTNQADDVGTFSVPVGLERHLEGYGSRIRQCPIMAAARDLARDAWKRKQEE